MSIETKNLVLSESLEGSVATNADDHLTRTTDQPQPETQVERSGASSCSFSVIGKGQSFEECLAGLILNSGKSVLNTIGEIMFVTGSRLPVGENKEMWEEISAVYRKYGC